MSHAIAAKALHDLQDVATEVLWRQWRAVGGSAASRESWTSVVDPEAIVLASLFLGDREPRLSDILFSWVEVHAPLLSVQRLKNVRTNYPANVAERLATFVSRSRVLQNNPRWRSLAASKAVSEAHPEPKVRRATQMPTRGSANLMLRLRTALGVGVKADALAVVLGSERPISVSDLALTLGYTKVGLRTSIEDLVRAGFVVSAEGRPATYAAPVEGWQSLLRLDQRPTWAPWHHWFSLVTDLTHSFEGLLRKSVSNYALDVGIRDCLKRHSAFFQLTAHELDLHLIHPTLGQSASVLDALATWAIHRTRESHPHERES